MFGDGNEGYIPPKKPEIPVEKIIREFSSGVQQGVIAAVQQHVSALLGKFGAALSGQRESLPPSSRTESAPVDAEFEIKKPDQASGSGQRDLVVRPKS